MGRDPTLCLDLDAKRRCLITAGDVAYVRRIFWQEAFTKHEYGYEGASTSCP